MTATLPESRSRLPSRWTVAMWFLSLAEDVLRPAGRARRGARQPYPPGPRHLADPVRADELLERVELLGLPDDLEDDRVVTNVDDARLEDVGQGEQLGAALGRRRDGEERELPLDGSAGFQLADAEH